VYVNVCMLRATQMQSFTNSIGVKVFEEDTETLNEQAVTL